MHKSNVAIRLFVTGGTFDKKYDELTGKLIFQGTHVDKILQKGRSSLDVHITTLMMIDSLDMKETERHAIANNCENAQEDKIIITHGTDTMVETAKIIAKTVSDKTIILTGAMIPYAFGHSDGFFNLGCALAFVQTLPNGVYIAMNGEYFSWDDVQKDKEKGIFKRVK